MKNILLLASKSASRKFLLSQMNVPFVLIDQFADESECDWELPLPQIVESIAKHKMSHVILPRTAEQTAQELFVLTADTLTQNQQGDILGKPENKEQAIAMIKSVRAGATICTAFCLDKKVWRYDSWQIEQRIVRTVQAQCMVSVPDDWIENYIENIDVLSISGALKIDEYGAQFVQSIDGSYTTIIGLPVYELRGALEEIGFY